MIYKGKGYDEQYFNLCRRIINEGSFDSNPRPKYEDGTPAHVKSVFYHTFKFTPNDIPLLFSKQVYVRQAIEEMLWIWQKRSNVVKDLQDKKVYIWDEWSKSNREHKLEYVAPREYKGMHNGIGIENNHYKELISDFIETKESISSGKFNVISKEWRTQRAVIQFVETGYITEVSSSQISVGDAKDWYKRTCQGLGYYGNYKKDSIKKALGKYFNRWVMTWKNMITRCSHKYNSQWKEYDDVYVSSEFQCCETFLEWVIDNAPMEKEKLGILQLDKDYYGSKVYSPETCILLTPYENTGLTHSKWYLYKGQLSLTKKGFARRISELTNGVIGLTPKGKTSTTLDTFIREGIERGDVEVVDSKELVNGKLPRFCLEWDESILKAYGYQLAQEVGHTGRNQVDNLIYNLKHNPESRRHVISLWNVADIDDMALTPCVWQSQWVVQNGKLHVEVMARSTDVALGLPFNVAQYWVLHKLIANEVGLEAGDMVFVMTTPHIYDRHIETIAKQMHEYGNSQLTMLFSDNKQSAIEIEIDNVGFYDFTMDNIRISGYDEFGGEPLKKYSFEVGI